MIRRAELAQKLILSKSEEEKRIQVEKSFAREIGNVWKRRDAVEKSRTGSARRWSETEKERTKNGRRRPAYDQESRAAKTRADYLRNLAERYEGYGK